MIDNYGLLLPTKVKDWYPRIYTAFRKSSNVLPGRRPILSRSNRDVFDSKVLRDSFCHLNVNIAFFGSFDPASGVDNAPVIGDLPRAVEMARTALALTERRRKLAPLIWQANSKLAPDRLKQEWFWGGHSDVGGGVSKDAKECCQSKVDDQCTY